MNSIMQEYCNYQQARWSLWDEIREGVKFEDNVARTLQERAWSSPIWYSPN